MGTALFPAERYPSRKDLDRSIEGKHVIVVEDIIDTGCTMASLVPLLKSRGAASVELAVCLDKKERRQIPVKVRYIGFEIPDEFMWATAAIMPNGTATCPTYAHSKTRFMSIEFR